MTWPLSRRRGLHYHLCMNSPSISPADFLSQSLLRVSDQTTVDGVANAVADALAQLHAADGCGVSPPGPRFSIGSAQPLSGKYVLTTGAMARRLELQGATRLDADSGQLGAQFVQLAERWLMAVEQVVHLSKDLQEAARVDNLTGVANRRFFIDELDRRALGAGAGRSVACLFVDIRNFKAINDHLGHEVGDEMLFEVAARMKNMLRDHDLVARLGKDQFGVLLDQITTDEHVERVVQRLSALLARPMPVDGWKGAVVGVALAPADAQTAGALLEAAEQALLKAKSLDLPYEYFARVGL